MKRGKMRSFGNMKIRLQQFRASGGNLRNASKFANVIEESLIIEDDNVLVISVIPPPELHMMMGGVGVHMNLLIKMFNLDFVEKWTKSHGIIRHGFQGGGYNGNHSKKILDNLDSLANYLPVSCVPIINSLRALNEIVKGTNSHLA